MLIVCFPSSFPLSSPPRFLSDYRQKHQGHTHQHQEFLLQGICELGAVARNDILSHHKGRSYRILALIRPHLTALCLHLA